MFSFSLSVTVTLDLLILSHSERLLSFRRCLSLSGAAALSVLLLLSLLLLSSKSVSYPSVAVATPLHMLFSFVCDIMFEEFHSILIICILSDIILIKGYRHVMFFYSYFHCNTRKQKPYIPGEYYNLLWKFVLWLFFFLSQFLFWVRL